MTTAKPLLIALSAGLIGAVCTTIAVLALQPSSHADADDRNTIPRLVSFSGALEQDGEKITRVGEEALWMRFDLTSATSNSSLFSQSVRVNVIQGRFNTMLGPSDDNGDEAGDESGAEGADEATDDAGASGGGDPDASDG